VHCFLTGQKTLLSYLVGLIDVGLTSSIGLSFLYNGLVDVGVMKENTLSSFVVLLSYLCLFPDERQLTHPRALVQVMFGSYALIFCAWVYEFQHSIRDGFLILYLGTPSFSLLSLHVQSCANILLAGIIMVGCGSYCITQVYSLYKTGRWEGSGTNGSHTWAD
jgi:hypothetical protein